MHVTAVMYRVGAMLENEPEFFFVLRNVDQAELISEATKIPTTASNKKKTVVSDQSLQNIFGIEIEGSASEPQQIKLAESKFSLSHPAKKLSQLALASLPNVARKRDLLQIVPN